MPHPASILSQLQQLCLFYTSAYVVDIDNVQNQQSRQNLFSTNPLPSSTSQHCYFGPPPLHHSTSILPLLCIPTLLFRPPLLCITTLQFSPPPPLHSNTAISSLLLCITTPLLCIPTLLFPPSSPPQHSY